MMNATLQKFGYPNTVLKELVHWCILIRPAQVTLGALVLASKHEATSMGTLPPEAHSELHRCTQVIEQSLGKFRPYKKINYLALMMVDPHVHFHVLPRYGTLQVFDTIEFPDNGWPAMPDLKNAPQLTESTRQKLQASLLDAFAETV